MKKFLLKTILAAGLVFAASPLYAQYGPQWGETPEQQEANVIMFNFFRDAYNNKNYTEAAHYLPELLKNSPKGSQNIYIYGINMFKDRITRATSMAEKRSLVDSLMIIYDKRIESFGDHATQGKGYILPYKANDYLNYMPADRDNVLRYYKEAIDFTGDATETGFLNIYFNELTNDYKADLIEIDEYLEEYERLGAIINLPANEGKEQDKNTFEALFMSTDAANCENLEKIYRPKIAANPTDLELLEKAAGILTRRNCKGEFFGEVAEQYYKLQPSSNTAMILAAYFEEKKDYAKSLEYLNAAIAIETDPETKANLALRIAGSELGNNNARSAADFARQALSHNPDNAIAYYFLAQAYAVGANQCSDFNRQAAFWLVYDTLARSRNLLKSGDPISASDIDSQMARYRSSFPSKEECFFRGLNEGQSYTVSCGWVSGTTTVRQGK